MDEIVQSKRQPAVQVHAAPAIAKRGNNNNNNNKQTYVGANGNFNTAKTIAVIKSSFVVHPLASQQAID